MIFLFLMGLALVFASCPRLAHGQSEGRLQSMEFEEEVSRLRLPYGKPYDVKLEGERAYIANGAGGLVIADLEKHIKPGLLGRLITGNIGHESIGREWIHEYRGLATAVSVSGSVAYLLTQSKGYDLGESKVLRIDVSDPAHPIVVGDYVLKGSANDVAALSQSRVLVTRNAGGEYPPNEEGVLSVLDFSEPGRARIVGSVPIKLKSVDGAFRRVVVHAGTAFVCGQRGKDKNKGILSVVSLNDPSHPSVIAKIPTRGAALDLVADEMGGTLYIADGAGGVSLVDVTDRAKPKLIATVEIPLDAAQSISITGRTLVVRTDKSIVTFDASDRLSPRRQRDKKLLFASSALSARGDHLALVDPSHGLVLFPLRKDGAVGEEALLGTVGKGFRLSLKNHERLLGFAGGELGEFDIRDHNATSLVSLSRTKWGEAGKAVFFEGTLAYVATEGVGLQIYETSDLKGPALLGEMALPPGERVNPRGVFVKDKVAYLALGRYGLVAADVRDPRKPTLLGRYYDSIVNRMALSDVKVAGTIAYLADLDNGLYLLDVADPRKPREISRLHTPNAHTVDVANQIALVANGVYGLQVVDVSNPAKPQVLGRYLGESINFQSAAFAADGRLYVSDSGWLRTFRLRPGSASQPLASPELVAHVKLPMGIPDMVRVSEDGRLAYMVNDEGWNFVTIDIQDPVRPRLRSVAATGGFAHGFALAGKRAFVCNNADACTIFDVTDPDRPGLVSAVMPLKTAGKAEVWGDGLFIGCEDGLHCVDISELASPKSKSIYRGLSTSYALGVNGDRRYVVGIGRQDGLQFVDVTDLNAPRLISCVPGKGFACVAVQGDTVYVGQGKKLLVIKGTLEAPKIEGQVALPDLVHRVSVSGRYAYLAGGALRVVDVGDPQNPKPLGWVKPERNEGTYGEGPAFSDARPFTREGRDYVAAVDAFWGLRLYDATDKEHLKEVGDFPTQGGDFTGIQAEGERVYVGNNWGGVYIVDVTDRQKPRLVGGTRRLTRPNGGSVGVLADKSTLYFQGNSDRTLRIVDAREPAQPNLLGEYRLPKQGREYPPTGATFCQLRGKYLYTPGLARIFDVSDPRNPKPVGECREAGFENNGCSLVEIDGRLHLVLTSLKGLKVVQVSEIGRPSLAGIAPGDYEGGYYFGRGLDVVGRTAYVTDRFQLNIVDLSDPRLPRREADVEVSGFTCDVKVKDGFAYVAGYYGGLHVIDVRDPGHPRPYDHFQQGVYWDGAGWDNVACYQSVDVADGYVYVTEYYSGLQVIRIGATPR